MAQMADLKMIVNVNELAAIYTLVAQMNKLMIRVEGMKAFNKQQEICGSSLGYVQSHFEDQEKCIDLIIAELTRIEEGGRVEIFKNK